MIGLLKIKHKLKQTFKLLFRRPKVDLSFDYEKYWKKRRPERNTEVTSFQKIRLDWIKERIIAGSTVLDYGCGDGTGIVYLKNEININGIAAEICSYAFDYLQDENVKTIKLNSKENENLEEIIKNTDYILLLEVLEHLRDPETLLIKFVNAIKKGVFFSVPNTGYFVYRIRLLFGSFPVQWRLHPCEHLRFWTLRDLKWWLNVLGISDNSEIKVYEGIPVLNKIFPSLFGMGFIVFIKK